MCLGYGLAMLHDLLPTIGLYNLLTVLTLALAYLTSQVGTPSDNLPQLFIQLVYFLTK
jgi:hypothetical protein